MSHGIRHCLVWALIWVLHLGIAVQAASATGQSSATVKQIRWRAGEDHTRVVVDLNALPKRLDYRVLSNPLRLFVDLSGVRIPHPFSQRDLWVGEGGVLRIRTAQHDRRTVRVVLNLDSLGHYRVFTLEHPPRLVIDVYPPGPTREVQSHTPSRPSKPTSLPPGPLRAAEWVPTPLLRNQVQVIVIDPGHGGKDPGAIGIRGIQEKEVVLDIARHLKRLLERRLGMRVVLTRNRDVFIPLEERAALANRAGADLFISIHVNAAPNARARGVETYVLGRATTQEAREVAARENRTTPEEMDVLERILVDLATTARREESLRLADSVQKALVRHLGRRTRVRDLGVRQAPFRVLVNTQMPGILVEVGFITHPREGRLLARTSYRRKIAEGLFKGIQAYLEQNARQVAEVR